MAEKREEKKCSVCGCNTRSLRWHSNRMYPNTMKTARHACILCAIDNWLVRMMNPFAKDCPTISLEAIISIEADVKPKGRKLLPSRVNF